MPSPVPADALPEPTPDAEAMPGAEAEGVLESSSEAAGPAPVSRLRRLTQPVERWLRRHAPGAPRHPRTLRDHALARRLHRTLARDAAAARLPDVRLYVASGTVVVEATVAHGLDRDLLVRLVGSVRGVVRVVARITVADGEDPSLP